MAPPTDSHSNDRREGPKPLSFQDTPDVQQRLNAYKEVNQTDVAYYTRVVKEAPLRAVDMLLYKDMLRHESDMRAIEAIMPQAVAFYDSQPEAVRARIDERVKLAPIYYRDKAFVHEVQREMNRMKRKTLHRPGANH